MPNYITLQFACVGCLEVVTCVAVKKALGWHTVAKCETCDNEYYIKIEVEVEEIGGIENA